MGPGARSHPGHRTGLAVNGCEGPSKAPLRKGTGAVPREAAGPSKITQGEVPSTARPRTNLRPWQVLGLALDIYPLTPGGPFQTRLKALPGHVPSPDHLELSCLQAADCPTRGGRPRDAQLDGLRPWSCPLMVKSLVTCQGRILQTSGLGPTHSYMTGMHSPS